MIARAAQGIEQLFPLFHGQSAQILAYIALEGPTNAGKMSKDLPIPRSTIYKLVSQLVTAGLVEKTKDSDLKFHVPKFSITIKNSTLASEFRLTPTNVLAFDVAHTPAGRKFIKRHGLNKFALFVELYGVYKRGKITRAPMAKKLGASRSELESLFSEIQSLEGKRRKAFTESIRH